MIKFYLFLIILHFQTISANTLEVCDNCEFRSINRAIEKSKKDDTIFIHKGEYSEGQIVIDKKIKIIGKDNPVVDGKKEKNVFLVKSSNVTIQGLVIHGSGISDIHEYAGIYSDNVTDCIFQDNILYDNAYGIYLSKSTFSSIINNKINGNAIDEVLGGNGIHLWSSQNIKIMNNKIYKHRDGLYLEFSENLTIEGNLSEGSLRYGMHFMFSHNNIFTNNIFQKNATGVAIMYSRGILIKKNKFYKNWGVNSYGILIKDITLSKFIKNEFIENTIAIKADSASRNSFLENQFIKNGWAIQVFGNCDGNEFSQNNFISNIFDISTNSRQNENKFTGNYWNNYDGYDLDFDKIGDKPYHPVKLFSFWVNNYPFLMVLFKSPIIEVLEIAEKAFPVLTPSELVDIKPQIVPFSL